MKTSVTLVVAALLAVAFGACSDPSTRSSPDTHEDDTSTDTHDGASPDVAVTDSAQHDDTAASDDSGPGDTAGPTDAADGDSGDTGDTSTPPEPVRKLDPDVVGRLASLRARSVALGARGVPYAIAGDLGRVTVNGDDAALAAGLDSVLPSLAPVFRLRAEHLGLTGVERDELGFAHARYAQTRGGLPVVGGEFSVHVDAQGVVYAASGASYATEREISSTPTVSAGQARGVAAARYDDANVTLADPDLTFVVATKTLNAYLAWAFVARGARGGALVDETVYVDAHFNEVVDVHSRVIEIKERAVYDAAGQEVAGTLVGTTAEALPEGDDAVWFAWENSGLAYDCLSEVFGRDSFDDAGHVLHTTVHFGTQVNNAFWYPDLKRMFFGDGDGTVFSNLAASYDVMVHELSHAVTSSTGNLVYANESGAINEAFSDIMAATCEAWRDGEVSAGTWLLGEDVFTPFVAGDALRYLDHPTLDGRSYDYYPERYVGTEDHGGVHLNSGIANLAFYLMVEGGTHPRGKTNIDVAPIGLEKAAQIFYRAMARYLNPTSTFAVLRAMTAQAAEDLYSADVVASVHAAWSAVGVADSPVQTPVPDEVAPLQAGQPATELAANIGESLLFSIDVPAGEAFLDVSISGGLGDADLYVRFGELPTASEWDFRPYIAGNEEAIRAEQPDAGTWYIMVVAYNSFSGVTLTAAYEGAAVQAEDRCFDGEDNDGNGDADCEDAACAAWPPCVDPTWIAPGALAFTEIMADPRSGEGDPRHEWVEVTNTTNAAIDLLGLEISDRDGSPERVHSVTESVVVAPGAAAVLAYSAGADLGFEPDYVYGATRLVLANSGDDVVIRRPDGTIIDEVTWGGDGFPSVVSGVSLTADVADAAGNDAGSAWCRSHNAAFNEAGEVGSPGAALGCSAGDPTAPGEGELIITEILYDSAGPEPASEWFEVLATAGPLQLEGVSLLSGTRSYTIAESLVLTDGQRVVFCRDVTGGPAGCVPYESLSLVNGGSVLTLEAADGQVIDRVAYDDAWPWPTGGAGSSIELSENHLDVVDNDAGQLWCDGVTVGGVDLGTPGAPNACAVVLETEAARQPRPGEAIITEIHYNSAGTEPYGEWFEVYIAPDEENALIDVQGVTLATQNTQLVIESPLVLTAGSFVVGCRDKTVGPPDCLEYRILRFLNAGDTFSIYNQSGELMDQVSYGVGGAWPESTNGVSIELSRDITHPDDNDVGEGWCAATVSYDGGTSWGTPHALNTCGYVAPREPLAGELIISEIMYNPSGTEPGAEWFEVINVGAAPLVLDGVEVVSGGDASTTSSEDVLEVEARAVYCRDTAAGPQGCIAYDAVRLNNGADDIAIRNASGETLDRVAYDVTAPWPANANGVAIELSEGQLDALLNDNGTVWCAAVGSLGGDLGTPGATNDCSD